MRDFKLGAKLSPKDSRDFTHAMVAPEATVFAKTFELPIPPVKNQGQVGSCVAHSLSYTRAMQEFAQTGIWNVFSVGYIYGNRLPTDSQEEGMAPREALKQLQACGDVLNDVFPTNADYPVVKAQVEANRANLLAAAAPYKISTYCSLNTQNQIKSALMQFGAVTICIAVYEDLFALNSQRYVVQLPGANDALQGYHEVTIFGWDDDFGWKVLNSWGENWGNKGWFFLPYTYNLEEAWEIVDNILPHPAPVPPKEFYRVQTGRYLTQVGAYKRQIELIKLGYKCTIEKQKLTYTIQMGAFVLKAEALALQKKLTAAKIISSVNFY